MLAVDKGLFPAEIADGAVTTAKIANNAVTAAQIAANTITAGQIAANTVTAAQIANTTITATQIANTTITATQLAANAVTATQLANNAVTDIKVLATAAIASTKINTTILRPTAAGVAGTADVRVTNSAQTLNSIEVETATGIVGFGNAARTAVVNLPAGTATRAPLKIIPGVAPTAPVDGDVWFTTAGVFIRISGVTRQVQFI